ncbi:H-NS family nucleoid-associated regulatory protein [Buttiauxella gaviniae]|uniref:H-NS family nucleoid-associated regulatory protein n=1 Tax=Buttiauxella gaviniae TaxID=82990 RepID=UPI0039B0A122
MITFTNNVKKLRASIYEVDFDSLTDFKEKFDAIFEERKEEEEKRIEETEKKKEILSQIRELLASQNIGEISADDLEENDPLLALLDVKPSSKKSSAEPKYEFLDDDGELQTWSGRGRMPLVLKAKIDAGEKLESYLITSKEEA